MTERRYSDEEVAAIFERAAEAQHTSPRHLPSGEGMTLTQLQEIGGAFMYVKDAPAERPAVLVPRRELAS